MQSSVDLFSTVNGRRYARTRPGTFLVAISMVMGGLFKDSVAAIYVGASVYECTAVGSGKAYLIFRNEVEPSYFVLAILTTYYLYLQRGRRPSQRFLLLAQKSQLLYVLRLLHLLVLRLVLQHHTYTQLSSIRTYYIRSAE